MNKQRLTKITKREKQAAKSSGAMDERIPEDQIRRRLSDEAGKTFEIDALLGAIANRIGWLRLTAEAEAARMKPSEIARQAADTIGVIDELLVRLRHLHPELQARAADALFRARGEFPSSIEQRIEPDLYRYRAALAHAARQIESAPAKRGPRATAWHTARDGIAAALREHSTPPVPLKAAKAIAVELLELCGHPSPRQGS